MFKKLTYKKLFLLDGLGALLTAVLLSLVLGNFENFFGVPKQMLYGLSIVALIFAIYSMTCSKVLNTNWRTFLRLIATLNIIYCIAPFIVLFINRGNITGFAVAYFIGEMMIILYLAKLEFNLANSL